MIGSRISLIRVGLGQIGRVLDLEGLAVELLDLVDDGRRRGDQREVVLALEPLLDDLHVQQPQKSAAKAEARARR